MRFLNTVGGGRITRIEGQMAYVDDEGFETPVLLKEVVVVMPAGHEPKKGGSGLMFDQEAFDEGKKMESTGSAKVESVKAEPEPELPVEETVHGDKMNVALAFEPSDVRNLDRSRFSAVLVNDSNYYLDFVFLRRADGERGWTCVCHDTVAPNEYHDIVTLTHETIPQYERIAFQCVAYKKEKVFTMQAPVSISRKLDLTKFHKFHCFRPGIYFENAVIEVPLVKDGTVSMPLDLNAAELPEAAGGGDKGLARQLAGKYKVEAGRKPSMHSAPDNPRKVLPLIEVDLHIGELTDSLVGMQPKDMLEMQLEAVRKHMKANSLRIGQKIVFIHGKGEGVLRKAVLDLLKKEYPKAELQDASFREYGFGATLVTIH